MKPSCSVYLPVAPEALRPIRAIRVVSGAGDALPTARLCNAVLAAKVGHDNADLIFCAVDITDRAADVFGSLLGLGVLVHLRSKKATMSQKPSVPQYDQTVPRVLTSNRRTLRAQDDLRGYGVFFDFGALLVWRLHWEFYPICAILVCHAGLRSVLRALAKEPAATADGSV